MSKEEVSKTPIVTQMQVIPVAGHDSMLLNLSGAHGPYFTRNIVILTDSSGNQGFIRSFKCFRRKWLFNQHLKGFSS